MSKKVAVRYSKALFLLGGTPAEQEKRAAELLEIGAFFQNQPDLKKLLDFPKGSKEEKHSILQKCFKGNVEDVLLKFLLLLVDRGRIKDLSEIAKQYNEIVKENLGIKEATMITALPIDEEHKQQMAGRLEQHYKKKIEILNKVDPSIIGGAVLVVGNQMLNYSIKERLNKLKESLLAVPTKK